MKKLFISTLLVMNLFAAIITGNQGKVSVAGGSVSVSAQGSTEVLNSGQITFISEGNAPTKARKIKRGDLNDVRNSLKAKENPQVINLKYPRVTLKIAKKIKASLLSKNFTKKNIKFKKKGTLIQIYLAKVTLKSIKKVYPPYYKAAKKFFKKSKNAGKVPMLTIKMSHLKRYHRKSFK